MHHPLKALFQRCMGQVPDVPQLLIVGLDGAGKTTLLYKVKVPEWEKITEDMAFMRKPENSEQDDISEMKMRPKDKGGEAMPIPPDYPRFDGGYHYEDGTRVLGNHGLWDVPGTPSMRRTWRTFYHSIRMHAVIFVVDASEEDNKRIHLAKKQLHLLMNEDELRQAAIEVIINQRRFKLIDAPEKDNKEAKKEEPIEDKAKEVQVELEATLFYKLGLHNLHPSCNWRTKCWFMDVAHLTGENDPKWKDVLEHIKEIVMEPQPKGMGIKHL